MSDEMPTLEARFWWATMGTTCCVVAAVTEDDARTLLNERFSKSGYRGFTGRISLATPEQWRRYTRTMEETVMYERMRRKAMSA